MSVHNTTTHFGWVTKTFHWLTAFLIITAIVLGVLAHDAPYDTSTALAQKAWLFSFHKTIGLAAFFVALLRVTWALYQPRPGHLSPAGLQATLAEIVHWTLYTSMIMVPLAGWVTHSASEGFAPIWWPLGQNLPFVPKSPTLSAVAGQIHIAWEKILIVSVVLHVAGALKHHMFDRDATLRRMLPGKPACDVVRPAHGASLPPLLAGVIFAIVGGIGALQADRSTTAQVAQIAQGAGNWHVDDGTLAITVQQFGSAVQGQFGAWQADINFNETVTDGVAGQVTGTITIPSLTLGSVTQQALDTDYFAASMFPTATYQGNITVTDGAYALTGTLDLKGQIRPFSMPFDLTVAENQATVTGQFTLVRLDFNIGPTDMGTVGSDVVVNVQLEAIRK
ncbi:MAG: cytochrome b/b6 domain-containing protein [Pseudomonadota bacterium]